LRQKECPLCKTSFNINTDTKVNYSLKNIIESMRKAQ
jgi:hypothetical protein